jgi:hypothetical protein
MDTIQLVKEIAQIVYYVALSVIGPLALIEYLKAKKTDQQEREYKTYDELDTKFFEYQKLALQYYDLDILDISNNDPSLAFDKKRKQELVAFAILFSLFERAFLMFNNQTDTFKKRQWAGWKHFLNDFLRRENIRSAWENSKATYDTEFQGFMDRKIAALVSALPAASANPLPVATANSSKPNGKGPGEVSGVAAEAAAGASLSSTQN